MNESENETEGRHAAPDDDPNSDGDDTNRHRTPQPGADPEDEEQIEEDREERLDPENRPDGAEIDNTDREFDPGKGMFTDNDDFDQAEPKFPAGGEQGA